MHVGRHDVLNRYSLYFVSFLYILLNLCDVAHAQRSAGDFRKIFVADPDTRVRTQEVMPSIVILVRFSNYRATLSTSAIYDMMYGHDPSVSGYFRDASQSNFYLIPAESRRTQSARNPGIFGWYQLPITRTQFDTLSPGQKRAESIRIAKAELERRLNYEAIDLNNDKIISQDELSVTLVWAGCDRPNEAVRRTTPNQVDIGRGYKLDQFLPANYEGALTIQKQCRDFDISPNRVIHALGHTIFGLGDQYPGPGDQVTEGLCSHSVMSTDWGLINDKGVPHLDPWATLQLGWSRSNVASGGNRGSVCYALDSVEKTGRSIIIPILDRGTEEYFILENRFPLGTYQGGFKSGAIGIDQGIAIWHIDESIVNNPTSTPPAGKKRTINHRRAIRLLRAEGSVPSGVCSGIDDKNALFDTTEPQHSYTVTDNSSPRNMRSMNDAPTGIQVTMISPPGETVTVKIRSPYDIVTRQREGIQSQIDAIIAERDELFDIQPMTNAISNRIDELNGRAGNLIRQRNKIKSTVIKEFNANPQSNTCP